MIQQTIEVEFNPESLPKWAQGDDNIIARCKVDLSFRCDVHDAKTESWKYFLTCVAATWNERRCAARAAQEKRNGKVFTSSSG